jgi:hypothetical protein
MNAVVVDAPVVAKDAGKDMAALHLAAGRVEPLKVAEINRAARDLLSHGGVQVQELTILRRKLASFFDARSLQFLNRAGDDEGRSRPKDEDSPEETASSLRTTLGVYSSDH